MSEWDAEDLALAKRMLPDLNLVATWNPVHTVYFRAGLLAARETMARFVEQGGDATTAGSIRANWWPSLGPDPGPPRQNTFDEVAVEREGGRIDHADTPPNIEALSLAWLFVNAKAE